MGTMNPRVSVPMVNAVKAWFKDMFGSPCTTETAVALATAVVFADDATSRYCVLTQDPNKNVVVFGPFAGQASALEAARSGALASMEGTSATVGMLVPWPKAYAAGTKITD